MEQERKIDVMIAEACHEEYVDIILDTIEAAATRKRYREAYA